jgi:hypothetical protein
MGQVQRAVHVPLGGDTERALGLPCQPASCQGGFDSVELLSAADIRVADHSRMVEIEHAYTQHTRDKHILFENGIYG